MSATRPDRAVSHISVKAGFQCFLIRLAQPSAAQPASPLLSRNFNVFTPWTDRGDKLVPDRRTLWLLELLTEPKIEAMTFCSWIIYNHFTVILWPILLFHCFKSKSTIKENTILLYLICFRKFTVWNMIRLAFSKQFLQDESLTILNNP